MDQRNITAGNIITGAVLIFCGVIVFPVAVGATASYPDRIWLLGLALYASSGALIYGGIRSIKKAREADKKAQEDLWRMIQQTTVEKKFSEKTDKAIVESTEVTRDNEALAHWIYTDAEWKAFLKFELKDRKHEAYIQVILITVLGSLLLSVGRGASLQIGIPLSLGVGLFIGYMRYRMALAPLKRKVGEHYEVTISRTAFLINGRFNPFFTPNYKPEKIQILDYVNPRVLELTYGWNTRKGRLTNELRVPIPNDKLKEAQELLIKIKS